MPLYLPWDACWFAGTSYESSTCILRYLLGLDMWRHSGWKGLASAARGRHYVRWMVYPFLGDSTFTAQPPRRPSDRLSPTISLSSIALLLCPSPVPSRVDSLTHAAFLFHHRNGLSN